MLICRNNNIIGGDKTTEYDIEKQVEKFWGIFRRQLSTEDDEKLGRLLKEIEEHIL